MQVVIGLSSKTMNVDTLCRASVALAVVLMDREENGKTNLANAGIKLHYLLTTSQLAQELYQMEVIDEEQLNTILKRAKKK